MDKHDLFLHVVNDVEKILQERIVNNFEIDTLDRLNMPLSILSNLTMSIILNISNFIKEDSKDQGIDLEIVKIRDNITKDFVSNLLLNLKRNEELTDGKYGN